MYKLVYSTEYNLDQIDLYMCDPSHTSINTSLCGCLVSSHTHAHCTVATLAFESDNYIVSESAGSLTANIIILESNLPQATAISVNVSTISGTAIGMYEYLFA